MGSGVQLRRDSCFAGFANWAVGPVVLMGALVCSGTVHSQTVQDPKREVERSKSTIDSGIEAGKAARRARTPALAKGPRVTYQDVLKDPDNIDLNFKYAKTQIRDGDLLGASTTLERILLVQPNLPRVRVLYALVLFRLDNMEEAERELKSVLKFKMPDSLRTQLRRALREVQLRKKRTRFSLLGNFAYQYDSNRNAAPGSGFLDGISGPQPLTGDDEKQPDSSFQALTRFTVEHDLGFQAQHRLFGSATYYHGEQKDVSAFDLGSTEVAAGGIFDAAPTQIRPVFYWRYVRLSHETFLNSIGLNVRADHRVSTMLNLFAFGQGEAQEYRSTTEFPTARLQRGPEYRAGVGASYVLTPAMRLTGGVAGIRKLASVEFYEYTGVLVTADHLWLLGAGAFLLTHASFEYNRYDGADPTIGTEKRRDNLVRVRLTLGVPLETLMFGALLPDVIHKTTVVVSGEYYGASSNITNFDYVNYRVTAGLSIRFDF